MTILQTPEQAVAWLHKQIGCNGRLSVDSRLIGAGDGFIAWPGAAVDGRQFVAQVLSQDAAACLVEAQGSQAWSWCDDARVALYPGLKTALAKIAEGYYGNPSAALDVLAVTGTNGKTSTSWWLAQALDALGHPCGVMGTLGVGRLGELRPSALTTPDPVRLSEVLRELVDQGTCACAIEASSIGLAEHRFDAVRVRVALLTNVTQDHLDYHKNMQAYWQAKKRLFSWPDLQAAVINVDDAHGAQLAQELMQTWGPDRVITYSRCGQAQARLEANNLTHTETGMAFTVKEGNGQVMINTALLGDYNVSNVLGVVGALRALGYSLDDIARVCELLAPVPGRMQGVLTLRADAPKVVVDYAHTPDALLNVLQALRPLAAARGGRLWCVFGCGGNRDASKRPLMGEIAQARADAVVVTSDNPRREDALEIIAQIMAGVKAGGTPVQVEADRFKAIAWTLARAQAQDVVLIAGKGHEAYQEVNGVRYPFADAVVGSMLLNAPLQSAAATRSVQTMMTLGQAQQLLQAQGVVARLYGSAQTPLARVHTDTRSLQPGDLFVALRGERFDANDFVPQAASLGAVAVLAERGVANAGVPGLEVANGLQALSALARGWRSSWCLPVIAVTGSNGKTTTTQMIASILRAWKGDAALATQGNFNNEIGVPMTLLRLRPQHRVAVVELGMNHPGEIERLAAMTQPTVSLVNNAQREHQEFMASVEAVAVENGHVIEALPQTGVAVYPADDAYATLWREKAEDRKVVTFALKGDASGHASAMWDQDAWMLTLMTPQGEVRCRLHCAGWHNVKNALAAALCAQQVGAPLEAIASGLDAFEPVNGRSQVQTLCLGKRQMTLVNDAYNANPDSVRAAIDVLATLPQPTLLVLGEMGEVGKQGLQFHHEMGAYAKTRGVSGLWAAGALTREAVLAFGSEARFFESVPELAQALAETLAEKSAHYGSILVKGSRVMRMEQVVSHLQAASESEAAGQKGGVHVA